jgi:hypothetical protein
MKKIIILIWLTAIAFTTNAQLNVEIKGNTVMVNSIPATNADYAFPNYIVKDASSFTNVGQYVEVQRENVVKRIYITSVVAFKVDGISAPISYTSIRDSLKNHTAISSVGSSTGATTSDLQKTTDSVAALILIARKSYLNDSLQAAKNIKQNDTTIVRLDTTNARLLTLVNKAILSDSIVLRKTLDSIHKVIDTLIGIRKVIEKVRIIDSVKLSYAVELKDSLIITNNLLRDKALLSEINEKLDLLNQQVTQLDILAELGFINSNQLTQTDLLELINNKIIASVLTPGTVSSSAAGTISAGARFISFANVGSANGVVNGVPLFAGETWTFPIVLSATYPAISFNATGTIFHIISIQ